MASRWMSLSSGKASFADFEKASWLNVLSPLMARKTAPRCSIAAMACPRPVSSGVQMPPQS